MFPNSRNVVFLVVLAGNALATLLGIQLHQAGSEPFKEGGFITILSALQLVAIAALCHAIFRARRFAVSVDYRPVMVWPVLTAGFLFLAADEVFQIHERTDRLIHIVSGMTETAVTDRIDDVLVGLYGLVGAGVLFACRREILFVRTAVPLFVAGFVLLFSSVVMDVLTNRNDIFPLLFDNETSSLLFEWVSIAEESLKLFSEAFFMLAFFMIWREARQRA